MRMEEVNRNREDRMKVDVVDEAVVTMFEMWKRRWICCYKR